MRIATADPLDSSKPFITFRGAGTSRGAGNRFLFHVDSTNTSDSATENGYHCIDAQTTTDVRGNTVDTVHTECGGPSGANASAVDFMAELTLDDLPAAAIAGRL